MAPSQDALVAISETATVIGTTPGIVTSADDPIIVPRNAINPVKAESRRLLKQVWNTDNLSDSIKIATRSVELYDGKGLHVLSAVNAVASFPGGLHTAVELLMKIVTKLVQQDGLDNKAFWASLRRCQGKFARQFKIIDKTLVCMVQVHWEKGYKFGRLPGLEPFDLFDRTTAAWNFVLEHVPHSHIKQKYLGANQSRIFALSRYLLMGTRRWHVAHIMALKATGCQLPQELVDMVASNIYFQCTSLQAQRRIVGEKQHRAWTGFVEEALSASLGRAYHNWFWCATSKGDLEDDLENVGLDQALAKKAGSKGGLL